MFCSIAFSIHLSCFQFRRKTGTMGFKKFKKTFSMHDYSASNLEDWDHQEINRFQEISESNHWAKKFFLKVIFYKL